MGEKEETKKMTVSVPVDLWKRVRRLEEDGKVKSFQDAAVRGLEKIVPLLEKRKSKN